MRPEHWIAILQITITCIGMVVGPWVAVKWSMRQKLWDQQQRAYEITLTHLSNMMRYITNERDHLIAYKKRGGAGSPTREAWHHAFRELEVLAFVGGFLLSVKAITAIKDFLDMSKELRKGRSHIEYLTACYEEGMLTINVVRSEAVDALSIKT